MADRRLCFDDGSEELEMRCLTSPRKAPKGVASDVSVVYNPAAVVDGPPLMPQTQTASQEGAQVRETQTNVTGQTNHQVLFPLAVGAIFVLSLVVGALVG